MKKDADNFNKLALISITVATTLAIVFVFLMVAPVRIPVARGQDTSYVCGQADYAPPAVQDTCGYQGDMDACVLRGYDPIDCRETYNECATICSEDVE